MTHLIKKEDLSDILFKLPFIENKENINYVFSNEFSYIGVDNPKISSKNKYRKISFEISIEDDGRKTFIFAGIFNPSIGNTNSETIKEKNALKHQTLLEIKEANIFKGYEVDWCDELDEESTDHEVLISISFDDFTDFTFDFDRFMFCGHESLSDFSLEKRNSLFNFIKEKKLDSLKENIAEYAKHYFITDNDILEKEEIENLELNFGA
jgi:hypothetical protein